MVDDDDYEDRATVVPVRVGSRMGPVWIVAATAAAVAVVTFAFGYRLGSAPPAASPTPRPTLAPASSPAPNATPSVLPSPDVVPESVSRRLRGAVSAAGGPVVGTWVVCEVAAELHCRPLDHQALDRDFSTVAFRFSESEWTKVVAETVQAGDIVVAAPLGGQTAAGTLALLSPAFDPIGSLPLTPVNADQQGVYFIDLGSLAPGQYVVAVGNLNEFGFGDGPGPPSPWASYYAGIVVTADQAP